MHVWSYSLKISNRQLSTKRWTRCYVIIYCYILIKTVVFILDARPVFSVNIYSRCQTGVFCEYMCGTAPSGVKPSATCWGMIFQCNVNVITYSVCYRCVMGVLWMCYERVMDMLWMCYGCVMNVCWMCYECVMHVLWMCDGCVMNVWWMCYECVMDVSWTCAGCVMNVWWMCYKCVMGVLWMCDGCVMDVKDVLLMCEGYVMDALGMCYGCVSCIVNGIVSVMLLLFVIKLFC